MSLQEIIVIAIVFFCVSYAGTRIVHFCHNAGKGKNPCANCSSGCELRRMMNDKKQKCSKNKTNPKKNCCG